MALPSSGPLSIGQIRTELGSGSGSLRTLSSLAGKSTPDAISEFYGYSAVPQYYAYYVEVYTCFEGSCYGSMYTPLNGLLVSTNQLDVGRYYPDASGYVFNTTGYVGYGSYEGHILNQSGPSSSVCWAVCQV
jgi:hypothetical protein